MSWNEILCVRHNTSQFFPLTAFLCGHFAVLWNPLRCLPIAGVPWMRLYNTIVQVTLELFAPSHLLLLPQKLCSMGKYNNSEHNMPKSGLWRAIWSCELPGSPAAPLLRAFDSAGICFVSPLQTCSPPFKPICSVLCYQMLVWVPDKLSIPLELSPGEEHMKGIWAVCLISSSLCVQPPVMVF